MDKITPHLWFDSESVEAAELYTSTFPGSKVNDVSQLHDTPSGDVDIVSFELFRQAFMAISAGPLFTFTPAVSFLVRCRSAEEVDELWGTLSRDGSVLMPLDSCIPSASATGGPRIATAFRGRSWTRATRTSGSGSFRP